MKPFSFRCFVVLCWVPLLALLAWGVDRRLNLGYHVGYHGELNKIVDAFETMPEIVEARVVGYNPDVAIEEMCIGIDTGKGQKLKIWFSESDPIRQFSGDSLHDALSRRMAEAIKENREQDINPNAPIRCESKSS